MKIKIIIIMLLLSSCVQAKKYTIEQLKKDAEYMYAYYCNNHVQPYLLCDSMELRKAYETLISSINKPMDAMEFCRLAKQFISHTNDGHTDVVNADFSPLKIFFFTDYIYFTIKIKNNKIYVHRVYKPTSKLKKGYEITRINGMASNELLEKVKTYYTHYNQEARLKAFEANFMYAAKDLFDLGNDIRVEYKDLNGAAHSEHKGGMNLMRQVIKRNKQLKNNVAPSIEYDGRFYGSVAKPVYSLKGELFNPELIQLSNYSYWQIDSLKTGILYAECFTMPNGMVKNFIDSIFLKMQVDSIVNLVLDLRYNKGGYITFADSLVNHFYKGSFYTCSNGKIKVSEDYIKAYNDTTDTIRLEAYIGQVIDSNVFGHKAFQEYIPGDAKTFLCFKKIIVLTGKRSYSLAVNFPNMLRYNCPNVLAIGEETGGLLTEFGNPVSTKLPNTGLHFCVSGAYVVGLNDPGGNRGFVPDIITDEDSVETKLLEVLSKKD